jgi:hypothetical protein
LETFIINQFENLPPRLPSKMLKIQIHETILSLGFECVWNTVFYFDRRVTTKHSLISSSYKIKTYWNILIKLVAAVAQTHTVSCGITHTLNVPPSCYLANIDAII